MPEEDSQRKTLVFRRILWQRSPVRAGFGCRHAVTTGKHGLDRRDAERIIGTGEFDMKRAAVLAMGLFLIGALGPGCRSAAPTKKVENPPPPPYMVDAVMKSLADIFNGSWGGVTVYIEKNAWLPDSLRAAGQNKAEVLTREELIKRNQFADSAPAMATIDAKVDAEGIVRVRVTYLPLRMKGVSASTLGGDFEYGYRLVDGKLVLVSRIKSIN